MGALNRFSDIVSSNLNTILEKAEDPRKMVKLATQQMQDTLVDVRAATAGHIADRKRIQTRIEAETAQSAQWQAKAELAINSDRDDLARAAIRQKANHDAAVSAMQAEVQHIDDSLEKLKHDAVQLEDKLKQARARQKALILRGETAKSRIKIQRQVHNVNYEDALNRFEAYERRLDELEGEVESYDLINPGLAQQIDELESNPVIEQELEALKSKMAAQS